MSTATTILVYIYSKVVLLNLSTTATIFGWSLYSGLTVYLNPEINCSYSESNHCSYQMNGQNWSLLEISDDADPKGATPANPGWETVEPDQSQACLLIHEESFNLIKNWRKMFFFLISYHHTFQFFRVKMFELKVIWQNFSNTEIEDRVSFIPEEM